MVFRAVKDSRFPDCGQHPIIHKNGLIEQAHKILKTVIIARKVSWLSVLLIFLLGIRVTPNGLNYSFTVVTGGNAKVP